MKLSISLVLILNFFVPLGLITIPLQAMRQNQNNSEAQILLQAINEKANTLGLALSHDWATNKEFQELEESLTGEGLQILPHLKIEEQDIPKGLVRQLQFLERKLQNSHASLVQTIKQFLPLITITNTASSSLGQPQLVAANPLEIKKDLEALQDTAFNLIVALEDKEATDTDFKNLDTILTKTLTYPKAELAKYVTPDLLETLENIANNPDSKENSRQTIKQFLLSVKPNTTLPVPQTENNSVLIPVDKLQQLGLCPSFKDLDNETLAGINADRQRKGLKPLTRDLPCVEDRGTNAQGLQRQLIQLNTINQFNPAVSERFGAATCGLQVLRNAVLLTKYIQTKEINNLKDIDNLAACPTELGQIKLPSGINMQWLTTEDMQKIIQANPTFFNHLPIEFINNVVFDLSDQLISRIQQGLKQNSFAQVFLIGTEDDDQAQREGRSHYFLLALLKQGAHIQYVVVDTAPAAYHLDKNSHDYKRLNYSIDMLETGKSAIKLSEFQ